MRQPPPDLNSLIENSPTAEKTEDNKLSEFMRLLAHPEEECPDEDCEDLLCPACDSTFEIVFGSLPLEVQCTECSKVFILRELLLASS